MFVRAMCRSSDLCTSRMRLAVAYGTALTRSKPVSRVDDDGSVTASTSPWLSWSARGGSKREA